MVDGRVLVGPHVRAACERHLKDLVDGPARGLYWDLEAALRVIRFFRVVLTVVQDGDVVGFTPLNWQDFQLGSVFGWKRASGWRRFRKSYEETAKGSGKTPKAAGIGLYMVGADSEARAEVYAAATKKDQAQILFRDAVAMVDANPILGKKFLKSGAMPVWQLTHLDSGSFFKPISNDDGQSGPRPHCALVDELHEHRDRYILDILEAGFKGRTQPLLHMTTNSGSDRTTVCYEMHEHAVAVANGDRKDDEFFSLVFGLDEGDDPLRDKTVWPKANPSLGVTIREDYLESQVAAARAIPGKQNMVLRLNFCVWTDADTAWMTRGAWEACEDPGLKLSDFWGQKCWGGLDLSWSRDLTALALVFRVDDEFVTFMKFWTPKDTALEREDRDKQPYSQWIKDGWIIGTDGPVIPLWHIGAALGEAQQMFKLQTVAYDRYRHKELEGDLADMGLRIPMTEHPQGFRRAGTLKDARGNPIMARDGKPQENPLWMPGSIETWENAILEHKFWTPPHPVFRWNIASVMPRQDPAGTGNRVFDKRRATGRIDGAVAAAQGIGAANADLGSGGMDLGAMARRPLMAGM